MFHIWGALADFLGDSLGVAAVLLVIGWFLLRWQQGNHRFHLTRTALERGITRFPGAAPLWLISLRHGVTMLALGAALVALGITSYRMGRAIPMPVIAQTDRYSQRPPVRGEPGPQEFPIPGPHGRAGPPRGLEPPPPLLPEMERWHQAQNEQTLGMAAFAIGIVLGIAGAVRMVFALAERRYAEEPPGDVNL